MQVSRQVVRRIVCGVLCQLLLLVIYNSVQADGLLPNIPRGKGETCVAPVDIMRRSHMSFIMHQRDLTVINGDRTTTHSLKGCVACHAQSTSDGTPIAVNESGQFCQSCHTYVAVKIDCFSCHAAVPHD